MLDPDRRTAGFHQLREDMRQVTRSRADVEDFTAGIEEREERFCGVGVHVRGGDCGAVPDGLRGVLVGGVGGVVGAVDLVVRGCVSFVYSFDGGLGWV